MRKYLLLLLLTFSGVVDAKTLYPDPNRNDFNSDLGRYQEKDFSCLPNCNIDNDKRLFVTAILNISKNNNTMGVKHDCKLGVRKLQKMSEMDVYDATYELSKVYYHGICSKIDFKKSYELLKLAADNGYIAAQKRLGIAYGRSDVLPKLFNKNYNDSKYWLLKSAKAGDSESAALLSYYYREGLGGDVNAKESFYWAFKTVTSKYNIRNGGYFLQLAEYYENGYGTKQDLISAYKFYDLSGTAGGRGKTRISSNMTDDEIQEAIQQSRAWQEEHRTFVPSYNGLQHQSDGSYR